MRMGVGEVPGQARDCGAVTAGVAREVERVVWVRLGWADFALVRGGLSCGPG